MAKNKTPEEIAAEKLALETPVEVVNEYGNENRGKRQQAKIDAQLAAKGKTKKTEPPAAKKEQPPAPEAIELENATKLTELGYSKDEMDALSPEDKEKVIKEGIKKEEPKKNKDGKVLGLDGNPVEDEDEEEEQTEEEKKAAEELAAQLAELQDEKPEKAPAGETKEVKAARELAEKEAKKAIPDEEFTNVKTKLAELETKYSQPSYKFVDAFHESGKEDFLEYLESLNIVNPNKLTPEELIRNKAKRAGLSDEETETLVESRLAKLEDMDILEKKEAIQAYIKEEKVIQAEILKGLKPAAKVNEKAQQYADPANYKQIEINSTKKINDFLNSCVGKTTGDLNIVNGKKQGELIISKKMIDKIYPDIIKKIKVFSLTIIIITAGIYFKLPRGMFIHQ